MSIVLSIFFFGLSIGSLLAGKFARRVNNPLLLYGITEGIIGLYAPLLIYALLNFHKFLAILPLHGSQNMLALFAKFFLVFLLLIIPTVLMGLTLPLLVKFFSTQETNIGKQISFLYGVNTLGAFLGAILGSFFFIPKFGVLLANNLMAAINIAVFLAVLIINWRYLKGNKFLQPKTLKPSASSIKKFTPNWQQIILISTALFAGFASISFEVVWNKYLGIFFGTNIYGLGIILALYLFGIGLGSLLLSLYFQKIKNITNLFINVLMLAILFSLLASYALNYAPILTTILAFYLKGWPGMLAIKAIVTVVILLLPTLMFGALLPLIIVMLTKSAEDAPAITGLAYAWNTVGSILGSYLAGIVFIPMLGSGAAIKIAMLALTFSGILVVFFFTPDKKRRLVFFPVFACIALVSIFGANVDFKNILKSAYTQSISPDTSLADLTKYYAKDYEEFQLIVEGKTGIISLSHDPKDGTHYRDYYRLKTNGLNESIYNKNSMRTLPKYEALLGLLSYLFVRDPHSAFIVGYGGGFTVDFLTSTDLPNVYVAELEEGIIEAANYVYKKNNPILKRENLRLEIEDARYVLNIGRKGEYDIIVSQPSHSWLSGVANLFTKEFFEVVNANLSEKGVFSQWLNLYNLNEPVLKSILKTFYEVFPNGAVFTDLNDSEMIIVGSRQPLKLNMQKLLLMTKNETLSTMLAQIPFNDPYNALTNYSLSRQEIVKLTDEAVINTDINAYAEVKQSALFYSDSKYNTSPQAFLSKHFSGNFSYILGTDYSERPDFVFNMLNAYQNMGKDDKLLTMLAHVDADKYQDDPAALSSLGSLFYSAERYASAERVLLLAMQVIKNPSGPTIATLLATLTAQRKYKQALDLINSSNNKKDALVLCHKANLLYELNDHEKFIKLYTQSINPFEQTYLAECGIYFHKIKGYAQYLQKNYQDALLSLGEYYRNYPNDISAMKGIVAAYRAIGNTEMVEAFAQTIARVAKSNSNRLLTLATRYDLHNLSGKSIDAHALRSIAKDLDAYTEK
ncbi:MAG: hypothetical protein A2504_10790 [Bdellovibrionales bacterium RIFOXYD12_FULL_39_22]|nr:MAG: hypothetical protein A2385_09355 [Bdellovibrionales bacterium RIFOXYB1_FULL_39_21]OFZ44167.1 MAG: hypothetical protein A2485_06975 [Bdellovibrionales bacterium RIFOXYC12_FULL_39_17]OFZ46709.1 MAG: hypothetical protein A2404_04210 [Bdellovibrionales bacterium RIFOXYC1_FULL_39_130]OFZ76014.1 MAG: hypothetical protein A2560_02940 [Bdellovibrionales bacterium RIFOXYD1_FULL_39_84]OFZ95389.1 MAG: hypothetical protein A2504_10790 [Bdellovibrionales bacterium RIFOXYD12_FULL_39_22]